jgi:DNA invertase Pin-like site-specific DNA recombinase
MINGSAKIVGAHLDRLAVVYLRQSSIAQVREHAESTMRQYGLVEEAVRLGWAREAVVVIDTDLGVSGRWGVARAGFAELVSRVCTGEVGAIFGLEISRLARSNAEVARLMEFAAITATLLIDADGIYDPTDVNDRMLLGLKSTMGEVELHVMAQRLQAAKRAAAARGELRTPLPVGYVYDEADAVVVDPDAELQAAIADLFAAFAACGSAYGVVTAFAGRRFPLRAYGGVWAGQLRWGALTHARVLGVLKNPCYAGAYVHGRDTSSRRVDPDGTVHTGLVERPRAEWPVLIRDHHEGYIGWSDYLANEARLAGNRTNTGARPPREGIALCQGIIACGSCGKPMRTNCHSDQRPAYECSGRRDRATTSTCRSVAAATVDDAVADRLLAALNPHEVALALAAADEVADRHHRLGRAAELAVERARYQADRAARAFHAVEPKNVWSHEHWKLDGKPISPRSVRRNSACRPHARRCRRYRTGPNSNGSPPTCPRYGRRRPPATRIENGCCAPSSPTSPCFRRPMPARCGSGSAGTPVPPTTSPSAAPPTPAPPNAAHRRPWRW